MTEITNDGKARSVLGELSDYVEATSLDYETEYYRLLKELKHKNKIIKNLKEACYNMSSVLYDESEV